MNLLEENFGIQSPEYIILRKNLERIQSICRLNIQSTSPAKFLERSYTYIKSQFVDCVTYFKEKKLAKPNYLKEWALLETLIALLEAILVHNWEQTTFTASDLEILKKYFCEEFKQNLFLIPISDLINSKDERKVSFIPKIKYSYKMVDLICQILNHGCVILHLKRKPYNSVYSLYMAIQIRNRFKMSYFDLFSTVLYSINLVTILKEKRDYDSQYSLLTKVLNALEDWIPHLRIEGEIGPE